MQDCRNLRWLMGRYPCRLQGDFETAKWLSWNHQRRIYAQNLIDAPNRALSGGHSVATPRGL